MSDFSQLDKRVTALEIRWTGSDRVAVLLADAKQLKLEVAPHAELLARVEHFIHLCERNIQMGGPL